ncbi:MAG: DUF971 domain-containing protein [Magnetovibrio sp.]|nr:DUF971 domain-containing protein [Magnetovibrio sp.]
MNKPQRTFGQRHTPTEIRLNREAKTLDVDFDNAQSFCIPIELLRVESPSAEVQGHGTGQKVIVAGKRNVAITEISPIGNYAVAIKFDDGHDSGYFTWNLLYNFGENQAPLWAEYIEALDDQNLSRDT